MLLKRLPIISTFLVSIDDKLIPLPFLIELILENEELDITYDSFYFLTSYRWKDESIYIADIYLNYLNSVSHTRRERHS